jgi:hypothetical protein
LAAEEADLGQWYRRTIVTNDGFVLTIDRMEAFEQAIRTKLIREISPLLIARTE